MEFSFVVDGCIFECHFFTSSMNSMFLSWITCMLVSTHSGKSENDSMWK